MPINLKLRRNEIANSASGRGEMRSYRTGECKGRIGGLDLILCLCGVSPRPDRQEGSPLPADLGFSLGNRPRRTRARGQADREWQSPFHDPAPWLSSALPPGLSFSPIDERGRDPRQRNLGYQLALCALGRLDRGKGNGPHVGAGPQPLGAFEGNDRRVGLGAAQVIDRTWIESRLREPGLHPAHKLF